jgi:hypothetical protein
MRIFFFVIAGWFMLHNSCTSTKNSNASIKDKGAQGSSFNFTEISTDTTYGYSPMNPINVGGIKESSGPVNQRRFLNRLLGPQRQELTYERRGSCCPFKTENGFMGGGLLDKYEITWDGLKEPVILYINMYDHGILKAPVGFTVR